MISAHYPDTKHEQNHEIIIRGKWSNHSCEKIKMVDDEKSIDDKLPNVKSNRQVIHNMIRYNKSAQSSQTAHHVTEHEIPTQLTSGFQKA